jgi:hypothetical protein
MHIRDVTRPYWIYFHCKPMRDFLRLMAVRAYALPDSDRIIVYVTSWARS